MIGKGRVVVSLEGVSIEEENEDEYNVHIRTLNSYLNCVSCSLASAS